MSIVSFGDSFLTGGQGLCRGGEGTFTAARTLVGDATFTTVFYTGDLVFIGETFTGLFFCYVAT